MSGVLLYGLVAAADKAFSVRNSTTEDGVVQPAGPERSGGPGSLVPWAKLTARLDFDLPAGRRVTLQDQFGLLTLWQHQHDAANFLYDQLVQRLP